MAFVPLFILSDKLLEKGGKLAFWDGLLYSFPAFLVWNGATTWWIAFSTIPGAIAAILLNALLMSLLFALWHFFRTLNFSYYSIPLIFIAFWCSFEFLHLNWEITWPWLNLGNVFASYTPLVQWYEYTGTFGGTIWILTVNFLIYFSYTGKKTLNRPTSIRNTTIAMIVLILPIVISLIIYYSYYCSDEHPIQALIVQPNTEAHHEQSGMTNSELAQRLMEVAAPCMNDRVDLLVAPESAIPKSVSEDWLLKNEFPPNLEQYQAFALLDSFVQTYPDLNIIAGISTFKTFPSRKRASIQDFGDGIFRESYNSAVLINVGESFDDSATVTISDIYHKSKLVPGVELMPYPELFRWLEKTVVKMGGFSYGKDTAQRAFRTMIGENVKIGAPICYESIFGEHFTKFVQDGAQLMTVITNDDWWGNTAGYKQHFVYAKLRAVETRRTIIRSANSGISAFINEKGDVLKKTAFREQTAIQETVYPNDSITFYVKHGDYLGRIALAVAALFLLFGGWLFFRKGGNRN
ncbi:MAG: apolipoprotein N-acyltransferase [Bacteroidales bacterium]|nr:apolipoprotein N-acyltransferase [Bacteroidales bacterium]